ncbi:MAG TPA: ECF RNA polymerase sigma factor SigK [Streptosporangiaceae bacterium]
MAEESARRVWPDRGADPAGAAAPSPAELKAGASPFGKKSTSSRHDDLALLLGRVGRGDEEAFGAVYERVAGTVFGLAQRVVRDPAQSEEVGQEVMLDIWRTASRFDPAQGTAQAWVATITHRRAVDRVRSAQAAARRDDRAAAREPVYDAVAEEVEAKLDHERVRRCLGTLTELQRESIVLAFYGGYTYPEVASLLGIALGTAKTRMRDGLIRLRDCLGVT